MAVRIPEFFPVPEAAIAEFVGSRISHPDHPPRRHPAIGA
jgi:hypothetical protein